MGGEKVSGTWLKCRSLGSPPHGQGKVVCNHFAGIGDGITPAWAGKRLTRPAMTGTPKDHPRVGGKRGRCCPDRLRCWDHPRIGGEKSNRCWLRCSALGSPPHGQGKVVCNHFAGIGDGITPARAGKRNLHISQSIQPGDHPRVGGEKRKMPTGKPLPRGSPPRRRGKAHSPQVCQPFAGITPA